MSKETAVEHVIDPYLKDLKPEAREAVTHHFTAMSDMIVEAAGSWGFEVIKHLAIFNGAGLAGATAFAQVVASDHVNRTTVISSAHFFIVGLMVAIIAMVTVYMTGLVFARSFPQRVIHFVLGNTPISQVSPPRALKYMVPVNWLLAALSIGCFFYGAYRIMSVA